MAKKEMNEKWYFDHKACAAYPNCDDNPEGCLGETQSKGKKPKKVKDK